MRDTKLAPRRWNEAPGAVLRPGACSAPRSRCCSCRRLRGGEITTPDKTIYLIPGYNVRRDGRRLSASHPQLAGVALHALGVRRGLHGGQLAAAVGLEAERPDRWVHEKAGPLAIGFVVCATLFSLCTQAFVVGGEASPGRPDRHSPGKLILARLPTPCPSCSRSSCRWRPG